MSNSFKYLNQDFDSIKAQIKDVFSHGNMSEYNTDAPALDNFIELITETADTLSFYLNKGAEEAHMATTEIYENALSHAKDLRYFPKGFTPPAVDISLTLSYTASGNNGDEQWFNGAVLEIPRYTNFRSADNHIYSLSTDTSLSLDTPHLSGDYSYHDIEDDVYTGMWMFQNIRLYEGYYKRTIFSNPASAPINVFTLSKPDNENIAHGFINAYVNEGGTMTQWFQGILADGAPTCRIFELRLTETLDYELTFGDGVHGMKLPVGDSIIEVFALMSSQANGQIDADNMTDRLQINTKTTGYDVPVKFTPRHSHYLSAFKSEFNGNTNKLVPADTYSSLSDKYIQSQLVGLDVDPAWKFKIAQPYRASPESDYESIEHIRANAPEVFSYQGLIMTKKDMISYLRANWNDIFHDVAVMNNWEFMTTYASDIISASGRSGYLDQFRKTRDIVTQSDSCDFNNVYIIGVPKSGDRIDVRDASAIKSDITDNNLKAFNYEMVIVEPAYTYLGMLIRVVKDGGAIYQTMEQDVQICNNIHCELVKRYQKTAVFLGENITKSDVRELIYQVAGVDYISDIRIFLKRGSDFTLAYNEDGTINTDDLIPYEVGYGETLAGYEFPVWSQAFNDTLHMKSSYIQVTTAGNAQ